MEKRYNPDSPVYMTIPEMADVLRISRAGAYNLAKTPGFPVTRLGRRKTVKASDLFIWLDSQHDQENV